MKVSDFIYKYKARTFGERFGICRVRTFINIESQSTVVITDLRTLNLDRDIFGCITSICGSLIHDGYAAKDSIFIQHEEDSSYFESTFEIVNISNGKTEYIDKDELILRSECCADEFNVSSCSDTDVLAKIERIRYRIKPYDDFLFRESREILRRRLEIEQNKLSKQKISEFLLDNPMEKALQHFLRDDLSVFGETYSEIDDEYICFSEFPIANGFVDYVVFTGRSRMRVILIEVKGANFNLVNKSGYRDFSKKIFTAEHQLIKRLTDIESDYEGFRNFVHELREKVQNGEKHYNSLLGPNGYLDVDPNKDIVLYTVVIGGRSNNDLEESRYRHQYEKKVR